MSVEQLPLSIEHLPLPPGSKGLPLLGEAAAIASNPYAFIAERVTRHGAVSRSRLMNRDLAILAGPEAAAAFLDEHNVRRAGGLGPPAGELFGAGVVNQLDASAHRRRKQHLMAALDAKALEHYLPEIRRFVRARLERWHAAGQIDLQDESIIFNQQLVFGNFVGLELDDATLRRYARGFTDFGKALFGLPIGLPGTPLARARVFRAELLEALSRVTEARRKEPTGDAASRLVGSVVDGEQLTTTDIALELQHLLFAASGLWAWFCYGTKALATDEALAQGLRAVAARLSEEPSGRELMECAELVAFVREVKRLALVLPITPTGVALKDFAVGGYRIPKGWLVLWATCASHTVPGVAPYESPERFDPTRYARGEGAGPNHFAPQGPGEALTSHRCGGVEYSTLVLLQFFAALLRGPNIRMQTQNLRMDETQLPARWKGGLQASFG
jgi:retinoid hydroxylase